MLRKKVHIKLNPVENHLVSSVARVLRTSVEELTKQALMDTSRIIYQQLKDKAAEIKKQQSAEAEKVGAIYGPVTVVSPEDTLVLSNAEGRTDISYRVDTAEADKAADLLVDRGESKKQKQETEEMSSVSSNSIKE